MDEVLTSAIVRDPQRWIFRRDRKIEHLRDKRNRLVEIYLSLSQGLFQPCDALCGALVSAQGQSLIQHLDHGVERCVGEELRTETFDPKMCVGLDTRLEILHQTGLADTGLTGRKHELPQAFAHQRPAAQKPIHLGLAPDEGRRRARGEAASASAGQTGRQHTIELDGLIDALQPVGAAILDGEQTRYDPMHVRRDDHGVGVRGALHARGDVGRVAEHVCLLAAAFGDDDRAAVYAHPDLEPDLMLHGEARVERFHRLEDRQPGAHRALGRVLAGLRVAEINDQTVAEIFGDMPADCGRSTPPRCADIVRRWRATPRDRDAQRSRSS